MVRRAFVLISSDGDILEALEDIPEVKETYRVYGVYDIIAKVEAETMPELKEIIIQRIRPLDKIHTMLTMICHDPGSGERGWSA